MLLLGMCCAHAACLHTNTRHGRRTLSANRGAVFESLSEAQETSLLCLLAVQNHYTDTMIPDRHRLYLACRPSRTSRSGQFTLLSQAEQSFGEALDGARQTSMVHALLEARGDESTW